MYKLCFFVPETHCEVVKQALFAVGAGRIGDYDQCSWQTLGTGQFRPLDGSNPHLGQHHQLHTVAEWKVEMVCSDESIETVVAALKQAHPYEEVAYEVYPLAAF